MNGATGSVFVGNKTHSRRTTGYTLEIDTSRVKRTKRLAGETHYRNQYIPAELPTLAFVPFIELTENSKYRMTMHQ